MDTTWVLLLGAMGLPAFSFAAAVERPIAKPLPAHPGNVFLAGDDVAASMPPTSSAGHASSGAKDEKGGTWRLTDYEGKTVSEGAVVDGKATFGRLPVGYYELRRVVDGVPQAKRVTVGVLAPLAAPTPLTSPISIDVAAAWFYPSGPGQEGAASLCALAGINWVRDRLAWREMEPKQAQFAPKNKYDETARKQAEASLQVLQVHHDSPAWANPNGKRYPFDLRAAYNFEKEVARRWKGQVLAFEPWNEADIDVFGGHTGAEMAALQKASYLGLKAGNPDVNVCMNVLATSNAAILSDLDDNQAWPYFDTFNLHHYCGTDEYPGVYAAFRAVSAGKPMWVSEFNAPVQWSGDQAEQEPTDANLRVQAERVAQVYASSLHEGPAQVFYFILGHYCEGQTQFGIIHKDLTPRPAFLAVAAVGRLLADARPLGRWHAAGNVRAFVFRARPDGKERDVLVAWTTGGEAMLEQPAPPVAVFDLLGRPQAAAGTALTIGPAPVFAVHENDAFSKLKLESPPVPPAAKTAKPSTVVLQALWPKDKVVLNQSAYRISSEKVETIPVYAYNFGAEKVTGKLSVTASEGWKISLPEQLELAPGERKELALSVDCRERPSARLVKLKVSGDFGPAGETVLALRLMADRLTLRESASRKLIDADDPPRWQPMVSAASDVKLSAADGGGVLVAAKLGSGDRWVYPILNLDQAERPGAGFGGLRVTLIAIEGQAQFRAIFDEESGSSYVADFTVQPKPGETVEAVAILADAQYGAGWSKPDDNGKLDADKIKSIKIGCNTKSETVRFVFKNVRWVGWGE